MADFTPTFDNPQMTDWPAGTNPGPPAAPAPAAAPGVAPADDVLGRDPAYQAFKRALGLEDTTAKNNTQAQVDALNQQEPISQQWLGHLNDLSRHNIEGQMLSRGIYRSTDSNTAFGNQAASYGHSLSALDADTQNRIAALQQALAQQETGFGTRDAEQQQAAYDRQALADQQATLNDQLTKALAAGSTLPDLQSLLPGGVNTSASSGIVSQTAKSLGLDPRIALAAMQVESGGNPGAVGDGGSSFGLFQLHRGGELGSLTPQQAFDPATNARTALSVMAAVARQHPTWSPGQIAAAAQRPADPTGYAARVDAIYRGMGQVM